MIYFTTSSLWIVAIAAVMTAIPLILISYRFVQGYQLSSYKYNRFFKWIKDTRAKLFVRYSILTVMSVLTFVTLNSVLYSILKDYVAIISAAFSCLYIGLYLRAEGKVKKKTPLKITPRIIRLYILSTLLFLAYGVFSLYFFSLGHYLTTGLLFTFAFIAMPILIIFASFILTPFEELNKYRYICMARKKLAASSCKVIGITGSLGKTSVKNILYDLLSRKYKCVKSRDSYNTPMGITRTILQDLSSDTEFLILEMGAREVGDIRCLCQIAPVDIAIVTAIAEQHMEYFKSLENIEIAKYEIVENVKEFAVFGSSAKKLFGKAPCEKYIVEKNSFEPYSVSNTGSVFTYLENQYKTELLGEHNIENIAIALMVARQLGLTDSELKLAVNELKPISNRLQLMTLENGITVIDDSYSSNPVAASAAFSVVSMFSGKKIIATPGFIEQGENELLAHKQLAEEIAKLFDEVILIGQKQTKTIYDTLLELQYSKDHIRVATSLEVAKSKFKDVLISNCVLLILNDLPDNFTESL